LEKAFLIVGGGIAGLRAALGLTAAQFTPTDFHTPEDAEDRPRRGKARR